MNPSYDFQGQVALVTGASSGMGLAAARVFAAAGAAVVLADVNARDCTFARGVGKSADGAVAGESASQPTARLGQASEAAASESAADAVANMRR